MFLCFTNRSKLLYLFRDFEFIVNYTREPNVKRYNKLFRRYGRSVYGRSRAKIKTLTIDNIEGEIKIRIIALIITMYESKNEKLNKSVRNIENSMELSASAEGSLSVSRSNTNEGIYNAGSSDDAAKKYILSLIPSKYLNYERFRNEVLLTTIQDLLIRSRKLLESAYKEFPMSIGRIDTILKNIKYSLRDKDNTNRLDGIVNVISEKCVKFFAIPNYSTNEPKQQQNRIELMNEMNNIKIQISKIITNPETIVRDTSITNMRDIHNTVTRLTI